VAMLIPLIGFDEFPSKPLMRADQIANGRKQNQDLPDF
jgi:hypothetical protein